MAPRPPSNQLDLLKWQPPAPPVARFQPAEVRAETLRAQICRAMKLAAEDSGKSRDELAADMSAFLEEPVSKPALDAAISQARDDHTINVVRFIAFVMATRDMRLLNLVASQLGMVCIEERYLGAVEEAMLTERIEKDEAARKMARRRWKGAP